MATRFANRRPLLATISIALWLTAITLLPANAFAEPPDDDVLDRVIRHVNQHADGQAPFSFNPTVYRSSTTALPIGVFDSGIGGLTVLEAIRSLDAFDNNTLRPGPDGQPDFENERFIYFGDQANMPYGNYAAHGKQNYLRELILKDAVFLLGHRYWDSASSREPRWDKPPVKAIVIACNTATAYGLEDVREAVQSWGVPMIVVGVVESGARGVNELIGSGDKPKTIAVMATVGTCDSMAYPKAIGRATGIAGKRAPRVIQHGSVALAAAIEGDPALIQNKDQSQEEAVVGHIRDDVGRLVESYRQSGISEPIEMVVLGCTHFPLVHDEILNAFEQLRDSDPHGEGKYPYRSLIAERIQWINPAELVAKELYRRLAQERLRIAKEQRPLLAEDAFFISVASLDAPPSARTPGGDLTTPYKYGRTPGDLGLEDTRVVPLRTNMLPLSSRQLIQDRLPEVWRRLHPLNSPR